MQSGLTATVNRPRRHRAPSNGCMMRTPVVLFFHCNVCTKYSVRIAFICRLGKSTVNESEVEASNSSPWYCVWICFWLAPVYGHIFCPPIQPDIVTLVNLLQCFRCVFGTLLFRASSVFFIYSFIYTVPYRPCNTKAEIRIRVDELINAPPA